MLLALTVLMLLPATSTAAASMSGHGKPVTRQAPARPPAASRRHGACVVHQRSTTPGTTHGLVWVRRHPTGAVLIWLPGLNAKQCRARRTTADQHRAEALAAAIERAPRVSGRTYACPSDDGTALRLYFEYRHHADEYAGVALSGCRWIGAPGRSSRWVTQRMNHQLKAEAPKGWKDYFD